MLVRYLIGEDWWHDGAGTAGQWSFEHRFVEAETEPFEHPSRCVDSCEFTHGRLGLGEGGRPAYPFAEETRKAWRGRLMHWYRHVRMKVGRAVAGLCA